MTFRRYYSNSAPQQTLAAPITSSATSLSIAGNFTGWPASFPFFAALDLASASMEIVLVTGIIGTTATISRGQDGTPAISHTSGATLDQVVVRQDLDDASSHIAASVGIHGVGGAVVGTTDTQTLTNKTLQLPVITGGTQASPTVTSPTITGTIAGNALDFLPRGYMGSAAAAPAAGSLLVPPTTTFVEISAATVTFTLATQRRIRVLAKVGILPASSVNSHYFVKAGYKINGGATQLDGTSGTVVTQASGLTVSYEWGSSYLLSAGSYSFFPVCQSTAGNAADSLTYGAVFVYDEGNI